MEEPEPADADEERVDYAAQSCDSPSTAADTDDPPLEPGESDLADAWWAR